MSRLPTLLVLLLAAAGLAPDLRAQATAPAVALPAGVRTLYLVRHGAYDIDDPRDEAVGRGLLPIGVAQARLTGDRLRGLPFTLDSIVASPLTRARETAEVIAAELAIGDPGAPGVGFDADLAECTPPTRRADIMAKEKPADLAACSAQLERLAARLLVPAPAGDRRELVVAHGNVIRWLVTRALAVDSEAWLGMSIGHASITVLSIDGKGRMRVIAVGDVGHLSPGMQTGAYGNRENWDLNAPAPAAGPIVLMISFDGFRWDYPELHGAPALLALARDGVRAAVAGAELSVEDVPQSLHAGHRPAPGASRHRRQHDVGSGVEGAVLARRPYRGRGRPVVGGEPIWVTAERRGLVTAASFWPGSEAAIGGVRPTFWGRYDDTVPDEQRVDEVLGWLDLPAEKRPRLITLYFDEPDGAGHAFGPASPEAASAVAHVDGMLARLRAGVAARGLANAVDWIVVSDHGMSATDPERTIVLADLVDLAGVDIDDLSTFGLLRPRPGTEDALVRRLTGAHPHLHAARKSAVPERLHYRAHRRIPEVVVWADAGWTIFATRADLAAARAKPSPSLGNHGYDPAERDMHGIFVAAGPSFKKGITTPPLDNVDVYPLLARLLGLAPAPNDGNPATTAGMLVERLP